MMLKLINNQITRAIKYDTEILDLISNYKCTSEIVLGMFSKCNYIAMTNLLKKQYPYVQKLPVVTPALKVIFFI